MIKVAGDQQDQFAKLISNFAENVGKDFSIGPIKTRGRVLEKAVKEEGGKLSNIKDINRAVVFIDDFADSYKNTIESAKDFFGEVLNQAGSRLKEGIDNPLYKKTIINIPGSSGQTVEVQLTTKKMWDTKIKYGDILYQEWRKIKDMPKLSEKAQQLWDQMENIYKNALE